VTAHTARWFDDVRGARRRPGVEARTLSSSSGIASAPISASSGCNVGARSLAAAQSLNESGSGLFMRWIQWQTSGAVSRISRDGTASRYRWAYSGPMSAQSANDGRPPSR
jgi:hypothetical protein